MLGADLDSPLSDEDRDALIDLVARKIVDRRLEMPVVLFLEMHKPLSFVASQAVLVAMPFLGPLIGGQQMANFSKLLQSRENIDLLIERIETMSAEFDEKKKPSAEGQE